MEEGIVSVPLNFCKKCDRIPSKESTAEGEVFSIKKEDIDAFIKIMKEIREDWTPEQVEETYGDFTLREALNIRLSKINAFYDYVEKEIFGKQTTKQ